MRRTNARFPVAHILDPPAPSTGSDQSITPLFITTRAEGWKTVAHAGEEGPATYVTDTVNLLKVDRVDHGVRAAEDPALDACWKN